jgi:nucleoside phosphorylase
MEDLTSSRKKICLWIIGTLVAMSWLLAGGELQLAEALPSNKTAFILSQRLNREGPYVGLVVPNPFEIAPLLSKTVFKPHPYVPWLDLAGRRFHVGTIEGQKVVVVMCGLAMLNSGITTQQLLDFFDVTRVILFGIAGTTDPNLNIGDTTVAKYWAHTGLWNWQRYGQGPNDPLSLESSGDYTRKFGYLNIGAYDVPKGTNLLNNVWYQPEEVYPVTGVPEVRQHVFFLPVDEKLYETAKKLVDLELVSCANTTTCLNSKPKVVFGMNGASANVFIDNLAYRQFLYYDLNISLVDMETAAAALVCYEANIPFIAFRSLSDLAGGGTGANQISIFGDLAAENAALFVSSFFKLL